MGRKPMCYFEWKLGIYGAVDQTIRLKTSRLLYCKGQSDMAWLAQWFCSMCKSATLYIYFQKGLWDKLSPYKNKLNWTQKKTGITIKQVRAGIFFRVTTIEYTYGIDHHTGWYSTLGVKRWSIQRYLIHISYL